MIASRQRPAWATSKRVVYGEVEEIGRDQLAMDEVESSDLLGRAAQSKLLAEQAEGWPAVIALAAAADLELAPVGALPSALHDYFAEELFQRASADLQARLIDLSLLPRLPEVAPGGTHELASTIAEAAELGFVSIDDRPELHPLLREFLLQKVDDLATCRLRVEDAIQYCLEAEEWDGALRLVERFKRARPNRTGHPGVLQAIGSKRPTRDTLEVCDDGSTGPAFPPVSVDVIEAEAALRDGNLDLAADLAARVRDRLPSDHPLRSRAGAIQGQSNFLLARFELAEAAFLDARQTATDDEDETEGLHGLGLCRTFGERGDVETPARESWDRRHCSPGHLLRAATFELARRRLGEGLAAPLSLEEPLHAAHQVEDPRVRTSFYYTAAYALGQQARYRLAQEWVVRFWSDVREYDLEFARPHVTWTDASDPAWPASIRRNRATHCRL